MRPIRAPYVDNGCFVAYDGEDAGSALGSLDDGLKRHKLVATVVHRYCPDERTLGLDLRGGANRTVRCKIERTWNLHFAALQLDRQNRCSGDVMKRIAVHLVFAFLVFRPSLPVLEEVLNFASLHQHRVANFSPSWNRELKAAASLVLIARDDLGRPIAGTVFLSESSVKGDSLMRAQRPLAEVRKVLEFGEKWRVVEEKFEVASTNSIALKGQEAGLDFDTALGTWAEDVAPEPVGPQRVLILRKERSYVEVVERMLALPAPLFENHNWSRILDGAWKRPAVIQQKECRAALLGLRRCMWQETFHNNTVLSLRDNFSEIIMVDRGRSANREMNALCRRSCACQLFGNVLWRRRSVPGILNLADFDSRCADWGPLSEGEVLYPGRLRRHLQMRGLQAVVAATPWPPALDFPLPVFSDLAQRMPEHMKRREHPGDECNSRQAAPNNHPFCIIDSHSHSHERRHCCTALAPGQNTRDQNKHHSSVRHPFVAPKDDPEPSYSNDFDNDNEYVLEGPYGDASYAERFATNHNMHVLCVCAHRHPVCCGVCLVGYVRPCLFAARVLCKVPSCYCVTHCRRPTS